MWWEEQDSQGSEQNECVGRRSVETRIGRERQEEFEEWRNLIEEQECEGSI